MGEGLQGIKLEKPQIHRKRKNRLALRNDVKHYGPHNWKGARVAEEARLESV